MIQLIEVNVSKNLARDIAKRNTSIITGRITFYYFLNNKKYFIINNSFFNQTEKDLVTNVIKIFFNIALQNKASFLRVMIKFDKVLKSPKRFVWTFIQSRSIGIGDEVGLKNLRKIIVNDLMNNPISNDSFWNIPLFIVKNLKILISWMFVNILA